jgi:hypothetical protein
MLPWLWRYVCAECLRGSWWPPGIMFVVCTQLTDPGLGGALLQTLDSSRRQLVGWETAFGTDVCRLT